MSENVKGSDLRAFIVVLTEYRAAVTDRVFPGEAGFIDDFQRREQRFRVATNALLAAACAEYDLEALLEALPAGER